MAMIINEEQMVEQNVFKFEDRLNSPVVRLLDQTPTFVTYYHINVNETTSDEGYGDAEAIVGNRSPIRFQKIEKFPIYGLDQIILQLQDTEAGLDTSYEGEATILPNTIKPLQNDYFVIGYLNDDYIFRIIEITYDNIRADNFYKIQFKIDANDSEKVQQLNSQVYDKYTCILENIGSENQCIIQQDYIERLNQIDALYSDMVSLYVSLFYNERHNVLLGELPNGNMLYDPYMSEFINQHSLLNQKNNMSTIMLEKQISDNKYQLKYERSLWRFVERKDASKMNPFYYITYDSSARKESSFYRWHETGIDVVDIPAGLDEDSGTPIFPEVFVDTIRFNGATNTKYATFFKRYMRNEELNIYDIDLDMNEELLSLNANLEMFFITPVLLFMIKRIVEDFLKTGIADIREKDVSDDV